MKPLLTKPFLDYLTKVKTNNKTLLEIGSGNSTVFFENIFRKVISLEDNQIWYDKVFKKCKKADLIMFNQKNIYPTLNDCLNRRPHYILIDNDPTNISRLDLAEFVHLNKDYGSMIILDNGEKNLEAYSLLKSNYYCLDFVGQRYDKKTSVTSLFFGEKLAKKVYV